MKTSLRWWIVPLGLLLTAGVHAQEPGTGGQQAGVAGGAEVRVQGGGGGRGGGAPGGSVSMARMPVETKLVKGAPYFAEIVTESVQTLADGNRIVRKTTARVYRDSQGRTRREEDAEPGKVRSVSISDPVAGVSYSLNPAAKTAFKSPYGAYSFNFVTGVAKVPADPAQADANKELEAKLTEYRLAVETEPTGARGRGGFGREPAAEAKTEKLAPRQIEGVMADGVRTTRTIPAGAIGNEQPIHIVTEEWRSPELQVLVMTRSSDPRTGESTYRLLGIQRSEPNASWFEVPADYTVRESGIRREPPAK
jgi:hypothetical protein